jgi:hypothetical protein
MPNYWHFVYGDSNSLYISGKSYVRESCSVIFILHSLWYTPLVYVLMNLFCQCDLLCLFFVVVFSLDVNITWITGHIHRSIVDKIYPTTEYIEMAKQNIPYQLHWITYFCEMWSEEFIYRAFNWSVKKMLMNRDEDPPPFFLTSKVEEWLMITCVLENCSLDLFVVLDLDLGSILIDNYVFLSLKSWK